MAQFKLSPKKYKKVANFVLLNNECCIVKITLVSIPCSSCMMTVTHFLNLFAKFKLWNLVLYFYLNQTAYKTFFR